MPEPGQMLSHYRLIEKIGEGGMGVVWKALDTTLDREVAIKILPESFAKEPDRLARFRREAKLLASLNHPGIAVVHGLDEAALEESETAEGRSGAVASVCYLTMELVAGDSLQRRLRRGALPLNEALDVARQVAEGLEAAHDHDIIHRDLKPANILFGADGRVKIVDFGLAKMVAPEAPPEDPESATTKSITAIRTVEGAVLGTAPYMSPEQSRGESPDRRVDIWAFGCVLYEMLTGRRAFEGKTRMDVLAVVLERDPDWDALPAAAPPLVRGLLRRCLAKEPAQRLHDIADARIEIEEALSCPAYEPPATSTRASFLRGVAWTVTGLVLIGAVTLAVWLAGRLDVPPGHATRVELRPPPGIQLTRWMTFPAISPDGHLVAFSGQEGGVGPMRLYLRRVDELEARQLPGTEEAWEPFFSPDGRWLGFQAGDGRLMKIPVGGGNPLPICELPTSTRGASWGEDGTILFALLGGKLFRVPDQGGEPELLNDPDSANGAVLMWPQHLPGSRTALVSVFTGFRVSRRKIAVLSLDSGEIRELRTGGTYPRYARSGHLVYAQYGTLYAAPFDPEQQRLTGDPVPVLGDVWFFYGQSRVAFSISESGSLVYALRARSLPQGQIVRIDRRGTATPIDPTRGTFWERMGFSPDGRRLAVAKQTDWESSDIWIYEMSRGIWTRLTFDEFAFSPVWSPDGEWIVYAGARTGMMQLFRIRTDGTGQPEQLTSGERQDLPVSFSPDGKLLAFTRIEGDDGTMDLMVLPLDGDRVPRPLLATPVHERWPAFSPDGHWVAYMADESPDQPEVFVRPYPGPGTRVKVSVDGGAGPVWRPDGKELFYRREGSVWAVEIDTEDGFHAGEPKELFEAWPDDDWFYNPFQVSPDGQGFVTARFDVAEEVSPRIVYAPNWTDELARMVAEGQ